MERRRGRFAATSHSPGGALPRWAAAATLDEPRNRVKDARRIVDEINKR